MKKDQRLILLWYVLLAVVLAVFLAGPWLGSVTGRQVPYSQFLDLLNKNQIEEVTVRRDFIEAKLKKP
ncbi:MAG TPA: ATP-dependent metallopeptidase FtsH/Yme1/Tma family protein, partial [Alphaproteobacteria bacterium]|nr:ATP-dependent metallopeptidase FtsH/Yme1/Tma family protein [Alphaproteobacteria bacterium]